MSTQAPLPLQFTPVPRAKPRSNGWKPDIQRAFIEALADTGSVKAACRRVGRTEHGACMLRRHPEAESFRAAWEAALALGIRRIEDVAIDRALNGVEMPVYSYGELVGTRTVYNDRLLMFLLRNRAPERFAEGRASAMNAVDRMELARMKKQWRKQWEDEAKANEIADVAEARRIIDAKLEELRQRHMAREKLVWERLSDETRAAHAEYWGCGGGTWVKRVPFALSLSKGRVPVPLPPSRGRISHTPPRERTTKTRSISGG
ncbi:hypothetical protein [Altererythrobacter litoralis]|uniref:Terminase small subunit n=1 Tax=Altererythrobacter litoralis TaxID=3113904 RepID=A0ABU7GAW4_9SPHN|nr:hypothetical protein [Erythrobacteraceae bacterium 1XM1-14]